MGGYILNREGLREKEPKKLYRQGELELMTTHQLREICRVRHLKPPGQGRAGPCHPALPGDEGTAAGTAG